MNGKKKTKTREVNERNESTRALVRHSGIISRAANRVIRARASRPRDRKILFSRAEESVCARVWLRSRSVARCQGSSIYARLVALSMGCLY